MPFSFLGENLVPLAATLTLSPCISYTVLLSSEGHDTKESVKSRDVYRILRKTRFTKGLYLMVSYIRLINTDKCVLFLGTRETLIKQDSFMFTVY